MSWPRVARPWAARLPGPSCCCVMDLIFTCCDSRCRTWRGSCGLPGFPIDRPIFGMYLIDRQSVCYLEASMDVSTFHAHRRSVHTPAGEIAYTEFGSGPAALFVHGIGTSGLLWRHVIEEMQDTTRCIAIDLPPHGGTPARDDMSVTALAQVVADLGDALGLAQVDLVGNDTGGAVAQVYAARHPDRTRSLTLTNCDCEGNFPPEGFLPLIESAREGKLAPAFAALAGHPEAGATGPLAVGYE